nr:glycogen debranching enzyme-like isoform X2 [Danaus plexippus plexippus]
MLAREMTEYARKAEKIAIEKRQMAVESREAEGGSAPEASGEGAGEGQVVRAITLNHGEHQDATLYRFEKGCRLQFSPGPSMLGRKVFLYTNYVVSENSEDKSEPAFVRNQYYALEWRKDEDSESLGTGLLVTDTEFYCELKLAKAGSFHYYFVYDSPESRVGPQGSGWFHVAPSLSAGGVQVPLDGVMCQTVLAKSLGPLSRWMKTLRVAHEAGFNMIHFTPVQELGASNSSYSLANQLKLNPRFNDINSGRDATFADVENIIAKMRNDWKMLSICDVVLNHTANESEWLTSHPEATYNCITCPHLRPAALLDAVLAKLGEDIASGRETRLPTKINTHQQIEMIRDILLNERLPEAKLHEMYICNVDETVERFYHMARNKLVQYNVNL